LANFFGLDFAFANNGIVILDENAEIIRQDIIKTTNKQSDEMRLIHIRDYVASIIKEEDVVYIEGLSYGSIGLAKAQMSAVHYVIRLLLKENDIQYKVIAPTVLKKFVTGKGQCKKNLILLKVFKKWGVEFASDDLADAYSLARMALEDFKKEAMEDYKDV